MVKLNNIQDLFNLSSKAGALSLPIYKPNCVKLTYKDEWENDLVYSGKAPLLPFSASEIVEVHISGWRRLTSRSSYRKPVYEVSFNIEGSNLEFKPGDTIGVIPQNTSTEVEAIINHLNLQPQADLTYELVLDGKVKVPPFLPVKSSIRHVLTHCLDIRSVVKKLFLLALSKYTKDETEKQVLEYLCSREGSPMYNTFVLDNNLCILDLLTHFKSCKPPLEVLFINLPRLLPRPYSIVNYKDKHLIKICFSVTQLKNNKKGLTTGFLEDLLLNDSIENGLKNMSLKDTKSDHEKVKMYLRSNTNGFKLPVEKANVLLIGTGTGVAPFIGFLEELESRKEQNEDVGETWLFFGCRDPNLDFIYEKELKEFQINGILSRFDTAFSRVENGGVKYVQDAISSKSKEVANFIQNGATIFVCGDQKTMAVSVRESIKNCFMMEGKSEEEAEKYVGELESNKKYVTDIWS